MEVTKKRLLVFTDFYLPHSVGGAELSLREVLIEAKNSYSISIVVSRSKNGKPWKYDDISVVPAFRNPPYNKHFVGLARYLFDLVTYPIQNYLIAKRKIEEFNPDLIHVSPNNIFFSTVVFAPLFLRKKIVIDVRNFTFLSSRTPSIEQGRNHLLYRVKEFFSVSYDEFVLTLVRKLIISVVKNNANVKIIAISNFMKKELVKKGFPEEEVEVVYNSLPDYIPHGVEKINAIAYAGRIEVEKGIFDLVNAFFKVKPGPTLFIAGVGSQLEKLKHHINKNHIENIVLLGHCTPQEILDLYAKCKIIVAPSRWPEPFGRFVIEAISAETPIISTNVGGIPELITNGVDGILVEPGDVSSLAQSMERALSDDSFLTSLQSQLKENRKKFEKGLILKKRMDIYSKLLAV